MSYTFAQYFEAIAAMSGQNYAAKSNWFALVDGARETSGIRRALRTLQTLPVANVFEDSFAHAALHLSPRLMQLSEDHRTRTYQMRTLDRACCELPMLSFLGSELPQTELVLRLRRLLLVEADGAPYLLRFADTQMLPALNSVLTPAQRSALFDGIDVWLTVDFEGTLHDVADSGVDDRAAPTTDLPLRLDAGQVDSLLDAVAAPVLVGQITAFDITFAEQLTHAQQSAFAAKCITDQAGVLQQDGELVSLALRRWRSEQVLSGAAS